jgi:arylsulfatase A
MLTVRYSWRTSLKSGVLPADGECLISKDRMTVASLLKANGNQTAMFGKWHLQMEFPGTVGHRDWSQPITDEPTEHGFDYYFGIPASMNYGVLTFIENTHVTEAPSLWTHKKVMNEYDTFRVMPPYDVEPQSKSDIEIAPSFRDDICIKVCTEKAVDYIASHAESAKAGKPLFIYLALSSPHLPHCPAPEFVGKSQVDAYGDFMMETDYRVGQILAALDEYELTSNTLVFQSSDNGAAGFNVRFKKYQHASNGELRGGKTDIYEGGHRVPFVMRWPTVIKPGRICDEPVCQVDLLATCADIVHAKLSPNEGEDSYSLLSAIKFEEYAHPLRGPVMHHSGSGYLAIRYGQWKLNLFLGSGGGLNSTPVQPKPGEPPFELYDMKNDWRETTNVYDKHPEVVKRLEEMATKIIREGRSTQGKAQKNDGPQLWPELTWIPEAASLPKSNQQSVTKDE